MSAQACRGFVPSIIALYTVTVGLGVYLNLARFSFHDRVHLLSVRLYFWMGSLHPLVHSSRLRL